jgi:acyl-CoA dehydrogenase
MEFEFPEDTMMLRDMLRRFLEKEARPLEMKYFNTGELKLEERSRLRKAIEQLGLWGLTVPEEYGGGGLDLLTTCLIEEELGKTFVPVQIGEINPLLYACREGQVNRYLEPALAGERRAILAAREPISNGIRPDEWVTTAEHGNDNYVINGSKLLDNLPGPDDFFIVLAKVDLNGSGQKVLTAFLIEDGTDGVEIITDQQPRLNIKDCRVGRDGILGEPGEIINISQQDALRMYVRTGARYIGIGERLIEMAAEHARTWVSFDAPLAARPAINRMMAEMRVDVESSRWLVYHAAWLHDEGKEEFDRSTAAQVRIATGEMIRRLIDRVTMVFTGPGPSLEIEPHRFVRSLIPSEAFELALEQARAIVAEDVLKI